MFPPFSFRETGDHGIRRAPGKESLLLIKPALPHPQSNYRTSSLEPSSQACWRLHSANNWGKGRKAVHLPMMVLITSSMQAWSLCFESPGQEIRCGMVPVGLAFTLHIPFFRKESFRYSSRDLNVYKFTWKWKEKGPLS